MKPLYLIFGEERFLVRREIERLKQEFGPAEIEILEGISPAELAEKITMPLLFAPKKLLWLKDFKLQENDSLKFALKNIPANLLVIIDSPPRLDRRTTAYKMISEYAEVTEFKAIPEWEQGVVLGFIEAEARRLGKKISPENMELIVDSVGRNLGLIASEIEKLSVYLGERKEITEEDIRLMISRGGYDAFTLSDAVWGRDHHRAFEALKKVLEDREELFPTMGLIASQLRVILKAKLLFKRGLDRRSVINNLRMGIALSNKACDRAGRFTFEELERGINALFNADIRMKSGFDQANEMNLLLLELMGEKK